MSLADLPKVTAKRPDEDIEAYANRLANVLAIIMDELDFIINGHINFKNIQVDGITTKNLKAGSVEAEKIAANAITAEKIAANSVTAGKIAANAVTAEKISVSQLSAIAANLGTITTGIINGIQINGSTITGGTVQTGTSGARIVQSGNKITIYDSAGLVSIVIDATALPPTINYYDSGVLKSSIYRIGGNFVISSTGSTFLSDNTFLGIGSSGVITNMYGVTTINGGAALNTITQSGSAGATLPQLEAQVNLMIQNLRAMKIYAT